MKVYYLSTTSFADCDINLLHHLPKKYRITYGVLFPRKNANFSREQLENYCLGNKIEQKFFSLKYRYRDPRSLITYYNIINSIIKAKPDLILINNFDQLYFNLLSIVLNKSRTVIAIHDVVSHSGTPFNKLTAFSRRILLSKFDKFLTFSPSQANLLKNITNKRSIHMIPLAIKSFGDLPQYQKDKVITNFLFFGNIKTYKGLDILLKSINRLSEKYNSFTLTIAGRCADWIESYEPLINNRKIVNAVIRFIDNDEIPYFFSRADYLILPYRDATQSGPLMIAYNYNIPVIASNIDGFKEFIEDKKTGFLFDPSSSESIDKVLEDAILRDEVAYDTLCTNVNHYKQNQLSVEQTAKSYGILFDTVIKTKKND